MVNTIKIQTEKPVIPIELGKIKLEFPIDDENIKNFRKVHKKVEDELIALSGSEDEGTIEDSKKALTLGFDELFGKGSFDKVYEQTPSVVSCTNYFIQVCNGLTEELQNQGVSDDQQQKIDQYLKKHKPKDKKKNKSKK